LKILFCAYDRPGHVATGPNAWLQRLIPDLREAYNLDVHTLFIYSGNSSECPTLNFFEQNNLPIETIKRDVNPFIADQARRILSIIKVKNFEVLVANLVIPAYYAARYLKSYNIPVVGVMHSNDNFYKSVIDKFLHGDKKIGLTHCVSVSNYINGLIITMKSTAQLSVIPCGTPLLQNDIVNESKENLKVIYAGRLETEQKQILKLTNAFLKASINNQNLEFSIYGDGSESQNIESILSNSGVHHKVHYKGVSKPSEMLDVMCQHQVFTLMSDYEGMPIALMEAMACGLVPVCLYEDSGINEIINHGVNGFIVKNRQEDYQAKLKILQDSPELFKTMSINAISTIQNKYSSEITHKKWFELFQNLKSFPTKKIKLPKRIKLSGELLYYGDNRKPSFSEIFKKDIANRWINFKLFVRPRSRLRALFKNGK